MLGRQHVNILCILSCLSRDEKTDSTLKMELFAIWLMEYHEEISSLLI